VITKEMIETIDEYGGTMTISNIEIADGDLLADDVRVYAGDSGCPHKHPYIKETGHGLTDVNVCVTEDEFDTLEKQVEEAVRRFLEEQMKPVNSPVSCCPPSK